MSEATIQSGYQTAFQAMSEFDSASVVINDWSIEDKSSARSPFIRIETADDFSSEQNTFDPETSWGILVTLIVRVEKWEDTMNDFRTLRQAIIDEVNTGNFRSAGGLEGTILNSIRNDGPIAPIYDRYTTVTPEAIPWAIGQRMILETQEF